MRRRPSSPCSPCASRGMPPGARSKPASSPPRCPRRPPVASGPAPSGPPARYLLQLLRALASDPLHAPSLELALADLGSLPPGPAQLVGAVPHLLAWLEGLGRGVADGNRLWLATLGQWGERDEARSAGLAPTISRHSSLAGWSRSIALDRLRSWSSAQSRRRRPMQRPIPSPEPTEEERRTQIARFRYGLIALLRHRHLERGEIKAHLTAIAAQTHDIPNSPPPAPPSASAPSTRRPTPPTRRGRSSGFSAGHPLGPAPSSSPRSTTRRSPPWTT